MSCPAARGDDLSGDNVEKLPVGRLAYLSCAISKEILPPNVVVPFFPCLMDSASDGLFHTGGAGMEPPCDIGIQFFGYSLHGVLRVQVYRNGQVSIALAPRPVNQLLQDDLGWIIWI